MDKEEIITWFALEYEDKERSVDWFWALGIIVIASAVTAVIYKNYFFAVILVLGGTLLGVFAYRRPRMVPYEMNKKGIKMADRFYPYENIKSFCVHDGEFNPMLFVKTDRFFMPVIYMPIETILAQKIKAKMLSKNVPEETMGEHASVKILDKLGF